MKTSMNKTAFFLMAISTMVSCTSPKKQEPFQQFLATIPDLELPFSTSSRYDLTAKTQFDTMYRAFQPEGYGAYGQAQVNDSVYAILSLVPGDMVYPQLTTYKANGQKIDTETLLHLPGGSTGYDENGISYLFIDKNWAISITDSIETFTRDSLENIIPERTVKSTEIVRFQVQPSGEIEERR